MINFIKNNFIYQKISNFSFYPLVSVLPLVVLFQYINTFLNFKIFTRLTEIAPDEFYPIIYSERIFYYLNDYWIAIPILCVPLCYFRRFQKLAFVALFLIGTIVYSRFFIFKNIFDYLSIYLCLLVAFTPAITWSNRSEINFLGSYLPIYLFRIILYSLCLVKMLSTDWALGNGFQVAYTNLNLIKNIQFEFTNFYIKIINYMSLFFVGIFCITPLVPYKYLKTRNSLIILELSFLISINFLFNLGFNLMALILLEISLISVSKKVSVAKPVLNTKKLMGGIALLFLGFINPKFDTFSHLNFRSLTNFVSHRWRDFIDDPEQFGAWSIKIQKRNNRTLIINQAELTKVMNFSEPIVALKYFQNLNRIEAFILIQSLADFICDKYHLQANDTLEVSYAGLQLDSNLNFINTYPNYVCRKTSL